MKRLSDILGIANAFDIDPMPTTVIERQELENPTAQQFALAILESDEYRQSLLRRILTDDLPPAVETKLMDYGWGKPKETIEHQVKVTRVVREIVDPSFDEDEDRTSARVN